MLSIVTEESKCIIYKGEMYVWSCSEDRQLKEKRNIKGKWDKENWGVIKKNTLTLAARIYRNK